MRALWLENGSLRFRTDVPEPIPGENEATISVLAAGICNTDLELVRGYYPFRGVPGHEFVGVVEEGPRDLVRRRVVGEINVVCHGCASCHAGRPRHCERRTVLGIVGRDGAFAERLVLPTENLHVVPDDIDDAAAVFVEPLAAALRVREQVGLDAADRVLVIGPGKLGQLVARALAGAGHDLVVAGGSPQKLRLLEEAGIATTAVEKLAGGAFDVAVECTGNPAGFEVARTALRAGGTLVLKSTYAGRLEIDVSRIVVDEIRLVGSRCGTFPEAIAALRDGTVDVAPLVDSRFPLADGAEAFERAAERGTLKVLLGVGESSAGRGG